jgi:DNA-binding GntR family transcriptional regulator
MSSSDAPSSTIEPTPTRGDDQPRSTGLSSATPGSGTESGVANPTVEKVHAILRERILRGDLPPGSYISQVKLAAELGVNRTPLREALRMLQKERLVRANYNRRVRVAPLTTAELEQLYAMRVAVESVGVRVTVPRLTSADFQRIEALLVEMERHAHRETPSDLQRWEAPHRQFHRLLVSHAGEYLLEAITELQDHTERYRDALILQSPIALVHGAVDHRTIATACADRDAVTAGTSLALHLSRTALALMAISDPGHEPTALREALRVATGDGNALTRAT